MQDNKDHTFKDNVYYEGLSNVFSEDNPYRILEDNYSIIEEKRYKRKPSPASSEYIMAVSFTLAIVLSFIALCVWFTS